MEILNPQQSNDVKITSPEKCFRGHDMTLWNISTYCESIRFQCCGKTIAGSRAYYCPDCSLFFHKQCRGSLPVYQHPFPPKHTLFISKEKYWLDKECAEMPQMIEKHAFHLDHSLMVNNEARSRDFCGVCHQNIIGRRVVSCVECKFKMDIDCAFRRPPIKHPRHEHSLAYLAKPIPKRTSNCGVCGKRCDFDLYHCLTCKFDIHYSCLPLPRIVKSEWHLDELSLIDVYLEDDSSEHYCFLCTESMLPQHGSYYCKMCDVNCHIECVLPIKIEDKDLLELDKEIADLEEKIDTEDENLVAAKEHLESIEKEIKALKAQYTASKKKRSTLTRKADL